MGKKSRRHRTKPSEQATQRQGGGGSGQEQRQGVVVGPKKDIAHLIKDGFLDLILSRGVDEHLNSREALRKYFLSLYASTNMDILFFSLLDGLAKGAPRINEISIQLGPGTNRSIIFLVCQWKFLSKITGWKGQDEVVDMVIRAGVDVNYCPQNKTNPMFVAPRYGSLRTVDLLLQAGIDIQQRDQSGRTCLYDALEHPTPSIIRRLLEYLPADEKVPAYHPNGQPAPPLTLPDRVIDLLVSRETLVSWHYLGTPKACDVSEVLMLLRHKGAHFSSSSCASLQILGYLFASDAQIDTSTLKGVTMFKDVAKSFVGVTIPKAFMPNSNDANDDREDVADGADERENEADICPICQHPPSKKVTLYCGHSFCRGCIIDYGKAGNGTDCPVCRRQLCLDLHEPSYTLPDRRRNLLKMVNQIMGKKNGPGFLSDGQVKAECQFRGIYSNNLSTEALRRKLIKEYEEGNRKAEEKVGFKVNRSTIQVKVTVDLGTVSNVANNHICTLSPKDGPVAIEVTIRDVPLLARISNRSLFTVVSKSLVDNLGLKRIDTLTSKKFVDILTTKRMKPLTFTCLEPFALIIGGVEVIIRTAIEASPDPLDTPMFGIQLGQDFLHSGLWCPIDVVIGEDHKDTHMRVDGEIAWSVENCMNEDRLRYYSEKGEVASVPILHFSPFKNVNTSPGISVKDSVTFEQCYWCCRLFPKGMKVCSTCKEAGKIVTYCDEKCQRLAYKIHRENHHQHDDVDIDQVD